MTDTALAKATEATDLAFTAPVKARALARSAQAAANGHSEAAAVAEQALGLASVSLGELTDAEQHLRAAVALADDAGLGAVAASTRGMLGYVLTLTGRTGEALRELDRAMPELEGAAAARLRMQRALVLAETSRFTEAAAGFADALEILRDAGGDALIEASIRNNRSAVLARLGDWRGAEEDLRLAEHGFAANGHVGRTAMVFQNRGLAATVRGDIPAALSAYDEAASRYQAAGSDPGLLPIERAEALLSVRLVAEAREVVTAAVAHYARRRNAVDLVQARLLLAKVALLDGDPETALAEAARARRSAMRQDRPGWAAVGDYLTLRARWESGRHSAATLESGRRAVAALAETGWVVAALDARLIVASLALALGRPEIAEEELAAHAVRSGPAEVRARAWHATALLRLSRGDRRGADSALRAGVRVIDGFRAGLGASELRAHASGHASELTGLGLRLAVEAGRPEAVLRWAERRHACALRLRPARPPGDAALATDLAALRQVAVDLATKTATGEDPRELLRRQAELENAVRSRARHATGVAEPGAGALPSVAAVSAALGESALVEYLELDGELSAVVVVAGRVRRFGLGAVDEVERRLGELRFGLRRLAYDLASPHSLTRLVDRTAQRLDDLLLAPLRPALDDRPLVIVPTGRLHELPWPVPRTSRLALAVGGVVASRRDRPGHVRRRPSGRLGSRSAARGRGGGRAGPPSSGLPAVHRPHRAGRGRPGRARRRRARPHRRARPVPRGQSAVLLTPARRRAAHGVRPRTARAATAPGRAVRLRLGPLRRARGRRTAGAGFGVARARHVVPGRDRAAGAGPREPPADAAVPRAARHGNAPGRRARHGPARVRRARHARRSRRHGGLRLLRRRVSRAIMEWCAPGGAGSARDDVCC